MHTAGKDATEGFYRRNHSTSAQKWMKDFEIGSVGCANKKWFVCSSVCRGLLVLADATERKAVVWSEWFAVVSLFISRLLNHH